MGTLNAKRSAARVGVLAAVALLGLSASAGAQPESAASDRAAGYIVLPKIVVHTTGGLPAPTTAAIDTVIQLTNTDETEPINVHCYWVNANQHCGGDSDEAICNTNADCALGLLCEPTWTVNDFDFRLTPGQPLGFTASTGLGSIPCDATFPGPGCFRECVGGADDGDACVLPVDCALPGLCIGSSGMISQVPEDPFRGELKCVQVDDDLFPVAANNLKAEATVVSTTLAAAPVPATTAASYNAIGFEADETFPPALDPAFPLCLGTLPTGTDPGTACNMEYAPCPAVLILNHFFERASPEFGGVVNTELTLVPCSEDLGGASDTGGLGEDFLEVLAQMLVYNEFEQRFSTSAPVQCYRNTTLADIDTLAGPSGDNFSIFAVGVQGTITGQTRIHGIRGAPGNLGYGLLAVGCEQYRQVAGGPIVATTAFNVHHSGFNPSGDAVYLEVNSSGP